MISEHCDLLLEFCAHASNRCDIRVACASLRLPAASLPLATSLWALGDLVVALVRCVASSGNSVVALFLTRLSWQ
jgi:hypothetical protein